MWCDIHLTVEKYNKKLSKREVLPDTIEYDWNWYYDENEKKLPEWLRELRHRSYNNFSILAWVRNGYWFAGVQTWVWFEPIQEDRWIPEDVSPIVKEWVKSREWDWHSHGWLTIKEILDYDFDKETKTVGYLTPDEYKEYKEKWTLPKWWWIAMSAKICDEDDIKEDADYIRIFIPHKYKDISSVYENVKTFADANPKEDMNDYRLVFFFDN